MVCILHPCFPVEKQLLVLLLLIFFAVGVGADADAGGGWSPSLLIEGSLSQLDPAQGAALSGEPCLCHYFQQSPQRPCDDFGCQHEVTS